MAISIPIISEFDGKGIKSAIREFKQLETTGQKAQFALKKAVVPATAALGALGAAAVGAVKAASDMAEAQSKANVIFGEGAAEIRKFAATAATKLGQSKQQVLDAAGTFGTFGKAAGLSGVALAKFSVKLSALASDLASFHNASPEEVIIAMGAALRGEAEPMRRFGVLLTADTLKAEALRMGLVRMNVDTVKLEQAQIRATDAQEKYNQAVRKYGVDSMEAIKAQNAYEMATRKVGELAKGKAEALTQEQKILAANSLIFRQTADAQGDFARTSDGLANSSRVLNAQFQDLKATLGQALLPAVTKILPPLKAFGQWAVDNPQVFTAVAASIGAVAAATVAVNAALAVNPYVLAAAAIIGVAVAFDRLADSLERVSKKGGNALRLIGGVLGIPQLPDNPLNWKSWFGMGGGGGGQVPSPGQLPIPAMANGGIVTSPTLALIGEAGPEAVVPLNKASGMGSNITVNVNGGDPQAIVDTIRRYMRQNGAVPIRTVGVA